MKMCNQTIYAQDDMAALIIVGSLTETEPSPRVKIFGKSLPWALGEVLFAESQKKNILGEEQNSRRRQKNSR
jgi:hypothetical protein